MQTNQLINITYHPREWEPPFDPNRPEWATTAFADQLWAAAVPPWAVVAAAAWIVAAVASKAVAWVVAVVALVSVVAWEAADVVDAAADGRRRLAAGATAVGAVGVAAK